MIEANRKTITSELVLSYAKAPGHGVTASR
jgi:hypothetical protein